MLNRHIEIIINNNIEYYFRLYTGFCRNTSIEYYKKLVKKCYFDAIMTYDNYYSFKYRIITSKDKSSLILKIWCDGKQITYLEIILP